MSEWHESRMWSGRDKEMFEDCVCDEASCGLVVPNTGCPQHSMSAGKTLRRGHPGERCPGVPVPGPAQPDVTGPVRTER